MKIPSFLASLALGWCLFSGLGLAPAWAERADRDKPMNIEADALRHDEVNQVSVFTGNVLLSKGSIVMRGAQLEVRTDADGYQFGTMVAERGQRAFFRQKREGVEEFIEGEAETIVYDGRVDNVRFLQRAEVRRLRGTTLGDEIIGNLIVYDNLRDTFRVDGSSAASAAGKAQPGGRIRAMLTPSRPAEPAAPASPALGTPAPALRPSGSLAPRP